jgi:hypothetical protein
MTAAVSRDLMVVVDRAVTAEASRPRATTVEASRPRATTAAASRVPTAVDGVATEAAAASLTRTWVTEP